MLSYLTSRQLQHPWNLFCVSLLIYLFWGSFLSFFSSYTSNHSFSLFYWFILHILNVNVISAHFSFEHSFCTVLFPSTESTTFITEDDSVLIPVVEVSPLSSMSIIPTNKWIYSLECQSSKFKFQSLSSDRLFATPWATANQASLYICISPTHGVYPNSCPLSRWCHPTISSSGIPFSSCPHSFPALGSFPMSQLFTSGGQSIGVSASASVLPMNTQDWSPLGWIGWISLQSKGLSRVFSNITVQKHQFFGAQLSL